MDLFRLCLDFLCFVFSSTMKKKKIYVYLTITRSNIQLNTIFLAKLSSLKSTYLDEINFITLI